MSIDVGQVDRALAILGPGARIDVAGERIGLLRYAKSRVTAQHTEDRLRVRVTRDGRAVSGTLETLDADAVRTLGSRLSEALAVLPAGTAAGSAAAGIPDPVRAPAVSAAVLRAGATDRHAWLDAIRANLGSALPVGGAIRHEVIDRVVAEAGGPLRAETLTRASLRAVAEHDGRTASVRRLNRDTAAIDVADIPDRLRADPAPSHLLMAPGGASEDDLIAACGAGLLISRLDYLRVLHPRDTLVTGTSRDATGWIRDGRVVAWHPQVRLTFRMDDVLRAVLAAGRVRERGETPFMASVTAPALLIDQGPIRL